MPRPHERRRKTVSAHRRTRLTLRHQPWPRTAWEARGRPSQRPRSGPDLPRSLDLDSSLTGSRLKTSPRPASGLISVFPKAG